MISRFKNALLNAVSSPVLDASNTSSVSGRGGGSSSTSTTTSSSSAVPHSYSSPHLNGNSETSLTNKNARLQQPQHHGSSDYNAAANGFQERVKRYEYGRPHFLQLNSPDEIAVTADHIVRPIIVPRDLTHLPWETGYAETINSGKSKVNEDQARMHAGFVKVEIEDGESEIKEDKLTEVGSHLCQEGPLCDFTSKHSKGKGVMWFPHTNITKDSLIVGALESAFYEMDELIREENLKYDGVNGGCTAVVCLFILGKVFISNAGDSRSILCYRDLEPVPLSNDFTPESERARIRLLAAQNPHLLGMDFTSNEYLRRPVKRDLGSKILYRAAHMTGWAYKTATVEDLKFPVVFGHGKRSRVLATIGVTRGFGDHELYAHSTAIKIKPFLTSQPEVKILDLVEDSLLEDAVVIMGTDGLWDVTSNQTVSRIVFNTLEQFPQVDTARYKYRYVSAAQDLVMHARGKFQDRNWRMSDGSAATIDDISVFVIPLGPYYRDALAQESLTSISLTPLPNSSTLLSENGSCIADSETQPGNEVNANVLATNTTNNNNGLSSSSSFNNNHNTDSVLNGDAADPSVELVSEAIDLEMDEPNH
ncbi:Protein phosphatase 1H [Orchesella cincta]|uniref:Protein phosphatase 1H n=1 Tax=Orchesella cincta TaxID=48709 RepID=A0A1D2MYB7_ORCCI|nr:Protein phosphatase 1H [Orchesella cincta]